MAEMLVASAAMPCSQPRKRKYRMPPPSYRLGRNDVLPLSMLPSASRIAHPVVVPRSRDRIAPEGAARPVGGGLASASGRIRVVEAIMVSERDDCGQGGDGLVLGGAGHRRPRI